MGSKPPIDYLKLNHTTDVNTSYLTTGIKLDTFILKLRNSSNFSKYAMHLTSLFFKVEHVLYRGHILLLGYLMEMRELNLKET